MSRPSSTQARLRAGLVLTCVPLLPLSGRLVQLQVLDHARLRSLAEKEVRKTSPELVPRGRIIDRGGRVLTESVPAASLYAEPKHLVRPWSVANALAPILGTTREALLQKLKPRSGFVWLERRLPFDVARRIEELNLPGIGLVPEEVRGYPNADLARNVLGQVGLDGEGQSGLERSLNRQLDGENRVCTIIVDAAGRPVFRRPEGPLRAPSDVQLTLDVTLQYFAEAAAREARAKHKAAKVMIVAQNPRSGDLLALAEDPATPLKNSLVQDAFEPGSTFKIVGMTGVLEEKAVSLTETIDCEDGLWEQSPRVFIRDHEPEGLLTPQQILERSSNIGMAKLVERIGPVKTYLYARNYGFGLKTGLSLPGESGGVMREPPRINRVLLGQMGFGQGISVTAVQITAAYSAVANGGLLMEPRLIKRVAPPGAQVAEKPPVEVRRVASPATIAKLLEFMEGVVERGTGITAKVPGAVVAGKTGTAQKVDPRTGKYSRGSHLASFCGFVPSRDPRLTVCVFIDEPKGAYYASETAAPVFSKLARQMLTLDGVASAAR